MRELQVINASPIVVNRTESLLNSISRHLSYRSVCRGQIYRVAIGVYDKEQAVCRLQWTGRDCSECIFFDITAPMYRHSGVRKYTMPAIQHIIIEHFSEVYAGCANGNQVQIQPGMLVPGIYEYRVSVSKKYRKWHKVS